MRVASQGWPRRDLGDLGYTPNDNSETSAPRPPPALDTLLARMIAWYSGLLTRRVGRQRHHLPASAQPNATLNVRRPPTAQIVGHFFSALGSAHIFVPPQSNQAAGKSTNDRRRQVAALYL